MAIVTRYFSTAAAGAGDATTWANRAAFYTGGAFAAVITGFSFAGSDSLLCYVGPGTYSTASSQLSVTPSVANPLFIHGCDSSGNPLTPPDPDWRSCQAPWDDSSLPVVSWNGNVNVFPNANYFCRLMKFASTGVTSRALLSSVLDWCSITASANNSASHLGSDMTNCIVSITSTTYNAAWDGANATALTLYNCRFQGVTGSSGNRDGVITSGTTNQVSQTFSRIACFGHGGNGFADRTTTTVSRYLHLSESTFAGNGGSGIYLASTASQATARSIVNCQITGNAAYGIDAQSAARVALFNCRLRDNTSGNINGMGNYPTDLGIYTTDDSDANEYVDTGTGDYRIKNTATNVWGKAFGAGDQPPASGTAGYPRRAR